MCRLNVKIKLTYFKVRLSLRLVRRNVSFSLLNKQIFSVFFSNFIVILVLQTLQFYIFTPFFIYNKASSDKFI